MGLMHTVGGLIQKFQGVVFLRHFLVYAPARWPLLLLLDGHSSHYNPDFIHEVASHGVVVFCLPPNTTHVAQPLDSVCFRSLNAF